MSRPPVLRAFGTDELVVDNFAGGGGASLGIEWALGRSPDIAVNHDPEAVAMHAANHPSTRHFVGDVWDVNPREVCGGRPVGLAWFSPDCFPVGTMVLTREGYRPIEQVDVGDEVLTHQCRWRPVTAVMSTVKPLVRLRGHGHPGLRVSPEHPFYVRTNVAPYWKPKQLGDPDWHPASTLDAGGLFWATPCVFPADVVPPIPTYRERHTTISADLLWLAGRYIADGWTRLTDTRADLVITCGHHKADDFRSRVALWERSGARAGADEMAWHERDTATARQFTTGHRGLVEWLRMHFGHGAASKTIPGWALGMVREFREALLAGYLSGDGCVVRGAGNPVVVATTVSKALAFGIRALAASLGHCPSVYCREDQPNVIQGRTVNTLPAWSVRWRVEVDPQHAQTVVDGSLMWSPIKEREDDAGLAEVFNLSVEEDESYVVEGIVVHNCTHHSKAKGSKPRDKGKAEKSRGLAWVVVRWAREVKPRIILLENVEEFADWGPLLADGRPDKTRKGLTFRRWLGQLRAAGYAVEMRELRAHDYGAPTIRKRLFIIARSDGQPIVWPAATHGPGRAHAHRVAAECIEWALPCPSIFGRKKPLADKTMRRIARGVVRFVVEAAEPFVVPLTHGRVNDSAPHGVSEPLRTITAAHRGELALVAPVLAAVKTWGGGGNEARSVEEPLRTVTCSKRGEFALVAPTLVQTGYGERLGQAPRSLDIHRPLGTIVPGGKHAVALAHLAKHNGGHEATGTSLREPAHTITTRDHHALVTAFLTKFYGTSTGSAMGEPVPTVTTGGGRGGGHVGEVRAFLTKYSRTTTGQVPSLPFDTLTTRPRFGLVQVHGEPYAIVDIGMRMLAPRELYRAQGFPDSYVIDVPVTKTVQGKVRTAPLTKTAQIRMCGNSVCPPIAAALVRANVSSVAEKVVA